MKKLYLLLLIFVSFLTIISPALADDPDIIWKKKRSEIKEHYGMSTMYFSDSDSFFVYNAIQSSTYGDSNIACILNTFTREIVKQYYPIKYARYSDDGKLLVGHLDSTIIVVGVDSMKKIVEFPSIDRKILDFDINRAGTKVFTVGVPFSTSDTIMYDEWDIPTGLVTRHILPDTGIHGVRPDYQMNQISISDTTNTILIAFRIFRAYPNPVNYAVWGIDPSNHTIKYKVNDEFLYKSKLVNHKTEFKAYHLNTNKTYKLFDASTGSFIKDLLDFQGNDLENIYTSDCNYWIISKQYEPVFVLDLNTFDTVYKYIDVYARQLEISPSGKYFLSFGDVYLALVNARWPHTSVLPQDTIHEAETLYPNPATDYINIALLNPMLKQGVDKVEIYDILGVPYTPPNPLLIEGEQVRLDVSGLVPGVYFVKIGDRVQRFVKI